MARGVKPMDRKKFVEAITAFVEGRATLKEASKILGRSYETTVKYFEIVLSGQEMPERAFTDELPKK